MDRLLVRRFPFLVTGLVLALLFIASLALALLFITSLVFALLFIAHVFIASVALLSIVSLVFALLFLANIVFAITKMEYHKQSKLEKKLPVNKEKKSLLLDEEPVGCVSPSQNLIRFRSPKAKQRAERLLTIPPWCRPLSYWLPRSDMCFATGVAHQ